MPQAPKTRYRLLYNGIELIKARPKTPWGLEPENEWSLPGGERATTQELIDRATARGLSVSLVTIDGLDRKLEALN